MALGRAMLVLNLPAFEGKKYTTYDPFHQFVWRNPEQQRFKADSFLRTFSQLFLIKKAPSSDGYNMSSQYVWLFIMASNA